MTAERILWVGVQTSGGTQNAPLEIAVLTTDLDGADEQHEYQTLVLPTEFFDGSLDLDPEAWHQHYASGLMLEFEAASEMSPDQETKIETLKRFAVNQVARHIAMELHGQQYILGGSDTWYLSAVLESSFPLVYAMLANEPYIDVSGFRRLLERTGKPVLDWQDRASADLRVALEIYRTLRSNL